MAEGRMLKRKISYDERVAHLSLKAALIYTWCIPHLDVEGRMYGDENIIKGSVVPYVKEISAEDIKKCQEEMINCGLIKLYGNTVKYMEFQGFMKNQTLRADRESPSNIPPPPRQLPELLPELLPANSGVREVKLREVKNTKLIKSNFNKNKESYNNSDFLVNNSNIKDSHKNMPSAAFQADSKLSIALKTIKNDGFNIYALISKAKEKMKQPKAWMFPEEVLLSVADAYWKEKQDIKNPWPWFIRVLEQKSRDYFAAKNITEHEKIKKSGLGMSFGEILKSIQKGGNNDKI